MAGVACAPQGTATDVALERLSAWLSGSFSSEEQAREQPGFSDIRLRVVRVWPERDDAHWLYVEQAVAGAEDRPYRQRVYRLSRIDDELLESRVYALDEPQRHRGAWNDAEPLASLGPSDLSERRGCAVLLRELEDGRFAGGTLGRQCASSLRGAAYATSEVVLGPDALVSWDRGFDANGEQVWGSTEGGYVFRRIGEDAD